MQTTPPSLLPNASTRYSTFSRAAFKASTFPVPGKHILAGKLTDAHGMNALRIHLFQNFIYLPDLISNSASSSTFRPPQPKDLLIRYLPSDRR